MSGQLLELIIFAGIALYLINKLISILGSTSDDDPARKHRRRTFFGETSSNGMKEVKSVVSTPNEGGFISKAALNKSNLKGLIVPEHKEDILKGLKEVTERMPNFTIKNFLKGAKAAFKMIIEAGTNENEDELEELVDMRYVEHFKEMAPRYGEYKATDENVKAEVSEIYMFGNNVFIKVLFVGKNVTNKIKSLHEEWTFSKNSLAEGPAWQLTNIDRPQ